MRSPKRARAVSPALMRRKDILRGPPWPRPKDPFDARVHGPLLRVRELDVVPPRGHVGLLPLLRAGRVDQIVDVDIKAAAVVRLRLKGAIRFGRGGHDAALRGRDQPDVEAEPRSDRAPVHRPDLDDDRRAAHLEV